MRLTDGASNAESVRSFDYVWRAVTVQQCDEVMLEETVERLNDFLDEQLLHLHVRP